MTGEILGRSRLVFLLRCAPCYVVGRALLCFPFLGGLLRVDRMTNACRLRIRADVRHFNYNVFLIGDVAIIRRFLCQVVVKRGGSLGSPLLSR